MSATVMWIGLAPGQPGHMSELHEPERHHGARQERGTDNASTILCCLGSDNDRGCSGSMQGTAAAAGRRALCRLGGSGDWLGNGRRHQ
jgi:hypothetical protein